MSPSRIVTAQLSRELASRVSEVAERLDRPREWIVREALQQFVDLEKRREALTKEALAEVTAGRVVPHAEIEAWAASLRRPARKARSRRRA